MDFLFHQSGIATQICVGFIESPILQSALNGMYGPYPRLMDHSSMDACSPTHSMTPRPVDRVYFLSASGMQRDGLALGSVWVKSTAPEPHAYTIRIA
jgi:hypothetical protein